MLRLKLSPPGPAALTSGRAFAPRRLRRRWPEVFNTDQGSQFSSREFTQVLTKGPRRKDQHGREGRVRRQHFR